MLKLLLGNKVYLGIGLVLCAAIGFFYAKAARYEGMYREEVAKVTVYENRVVDFENTIQLLNYSVGRQNTALHLLALEQVKSQEVMKAALSAIKPINEFKKGIILELEAAKLKTISCEAAIVEVKAQLEKEVQNEGI